MPTVADSHALRRQLENSHTSAKLAILAMVFKYAERTEAEMELAYAVSSLADAYDKLGKTP